VTIVWHTKAGGHRLPLPFDQVRWWMFQHAPPGYRFRRFFGQTDLRVSWPERVLYDNCLFFVKRMQRGLWHPRCMLNFQWAAKLSRWSGHRRCRRHRHRVGKRVVGAVRDIEVSRDPGSSMLSRVTIVAPVT
jgi:hypothetical protein